ncbi:hypothetical protein llg_17400 [Luteolibacter sp. LG18]|nr:hypothetical protein llg_17400 [Luteolibacter sp. LG18]
MPAADKAAKGLGLTDEEKKAGLVTVSVMPVGFIPPPIIKLDASGMPRETYRNPMEFPPVVYKVKTAKGEVKIIGAQNQLGPSSVIPRQESTTLYYVSPPDPKSTTEQKGEDLRPIGKLAIAPDATHLLVVIWKEPSEKMWNSPKYKVIDVSPSKLAPNSLTAINASEATLTIQSGKGPFKMAPGFMGRVELPLNKQGEVPMYVATSANGELEPLSQTVVSTATDSRIFLVAWEAPKSRATPAGVMMTVGSKQLVLPTLPPDTSQAALDRP